VERNPGPPRSGRIPCDRAEAGSKIAGLALAEKFYVDMPYALAELPARR
jgi:hypothetical protein